jgi:hypothetical protein
MDGFARREFQLVLLRRMADYQPDLVTAAVRSLDATRTEMRHVNARWQRMLRSTRFPSGERRLRLVLGPPVAHADRRLGDVICRLVWWELPLWPDLRFEALVGPDRIDSAGVAGPARDVSGAETRFGVFDLREGCQYSAARS